MNEVAQILSRGACVGCSMRPDQVEFPPFEPGLVGGHCIGVDLYYLSFHAQRLGHDRGDPRRPRDQR